LYADNGLFYKIVNINFNFFCILEQHSVSQNTKLHYVTKLQEKILLLDDNARLIILSLFLMELYSRQLHIFKIVCFVDSQI